MESLRLFYTGNNNDSRGEVYSHLAYNGMEYTKAINAENLESIVTEPLFQYMNVKNYINSDKIDDDIISSQFIEFIVDVGIFHAKLDDKKPISNDMVKKTIFNTVYKGNSVPIEVKKFYLTFLHVINISTNTVVTNFDSITDLSTIRFNMAKVDLTAESKKKILFAETIPLLPEINGFNFDKNKIIKLNDTYKENFINKLRGLRNIIIENPGKSAVAAAIAVAATPLLSTLATTLGTWLGYGALTPGPATSTALSIIEAPVCLPIIESVTNMANLFSSVQQSTAVGFFNATAASMYASSLSLMGGGNGFHFTPLNTFLRDLYNVCYGGIDNFPISKDTAIKLESSKSIKFDVDLQKITMNILNARDRIVKPTSKQQITEIEDLYESVVTGVRYVRDSDGVLRKLNDDNTMGTRFDNSELDEILKPNTSNCGSTGVKHASCEEVYKCLLSGKPESLAECLGQLSNADMFNVARKEVNNMHPKIAIQLLRTFGFKLRKEPGSDIIMPCKFDEWLQRLEKSIDVQTAKVIRENKKLLEYLRSVVNIVRANPAIINTNSKNCVLSDFARKSGLTVFRNPLPHKTIQKNMIDGLLYTPQHLNQSTHLPLALQIANVSSRVKMPMSGGGNGGGNNMECVNANNLKQSFNLIYAEMEKNGKKLVDSDKALIDATINKFSNLEYQLVRLMDDAKLFSKLHAAASVDNYSENITLDDIVNVKSNDITGNTLRNLNDCILKNINTQTKLSQNLINKVQIPLLQLLMK
jgi:hypothetical protein